MADGAQGWITKAARDRDALVKRLTVLKGKAERGQRPSDKPFGRWLGDFLDQAPNHGLLSGELKLLQACGTGKPCDLTPPSRLLRTKRVLARARKRGAFRWRPNRVRAGFLRFLALGGDKFAPVYESGIELYNARIDTSGLSYQALDLRSAICVGRLAFINCELNGPLSIEDAAIVMLALNGTKVAKISGNRAKISGSVFLSRNDGENFVSNGDVQLFSAKIGGSLNCTSATINGTLTCARTEIGSDLICEQGNFMKGIEAQGATIAGNLRFSSLSARRAISLAGADVGGSVWCAGATLRKNQQDTGYTAATMLDFSRATIKGNVSLNRDKQKPFICEGSVAFVSANIGGDLNFWSASITVAQTEKGDVSSLDGQNLKAGGSIFFGGGFETNGRVSLYGAEISRDLDFSGSIFRNAPGWAIVADMAKVSGSLKFQTSGDGQERYSFEASGGVSLVGARCAEMNCEGGKFKNPGGAALDCTSMNIAGSVILATSAEVRFESVGVVSFNSARIGQDLKCFGGRMGDPKAVPDPKSVALDCGAAIISGCASLRNAGGTPFEAFGQVSFYFARIGINLECVGGRFSNPKGYSLYCQGSNVKGCVFVGEANPDWVDSKELAGWAFWSDGIVTFVGATIGLQFSCQTGYFRNGEESPAGSGQAAIALDLSVAKIADTLFMGMEGSQPPKIEGSVELRGATVRVLEDDGLVDDATRGLRPAVDRNDPNGLPKALRCVIALDQFSYDRLKGDRACDSDMRKAWLRRQPPEDLQAAFKPQPFEQLITVMRAMGYDDEADDIALFKRQTKRKTKPLIDIPEVDWRFPSQAAGVVAAAWLAILGDKAAWLAILGDKLVLGYVLLLWLFRKVLAKLGEVLLLDWFVGYGYNMARAVFLLLLLVFGFGNFYAWAFQQGAIVPADKDVRDAASQPATLLEMVPPSNEVSFKIVAAPECKIWSVEKCKGIAHQAIPLFNPWLYSADVMVPIVAFGQKAAWAPVPYVAIKLPVVGQLEAPSNFVYDVQLVETVLGWVEGFLLVSFVTGLISKE